MILCDGSYFRDVSILERRRSLTQKLSLVTKSQKSNNSAQYGMKKNVLSRLLEE